MREAGAEVLDYREEPAEAVYAGARRCSVELALEMDGEKIEIGDVFYAAVVRTGWAALVDAMRVSSPGDDDLAHDIIESLEFSDEAGCFREAIDRILD